MLRAGVHQFWPYMNDGSNHLIVVLEEVVDHPLPAPFAFIRVVDREYHYPRRRHLLNTDCLFQLDDALA